MSGVFEDIAAAVGYTPLVRLNRLGSGKATILAKLESKNPAASVSTRTRARILRASRGGRTAVTVASLAGFYILYLLTKGSLPPGWAWFILAVPGFLFLWCWIRARHEDARRA